MSSVLFVPSYDVWVKGTKINQDRKKCIDSVEIKETVDGADTCTINISDPEFIFIEDNIFLEKSSLKVQLGFDGCTTKQTFEGYISAVDISFPENGIPQLTITGMDKTHLMNRTKKNKTWTNTTSAKIVESIAKSYGFKCVVESGYNFKTKESISQSKQTDADFLQKLAKDEIYPFTCRLVGNTIYYVKKGKISSSVMTLHYLEYPHEIINFTPQINTETRQEDTGSSSVSNSKSTSSSSSSSSSSRGSSSSGSSSSSSKTSGGSSSSSSSSTKKTKTYDPVTKKWK